MSWRFALSPKWIVRHVARGAPRRGDGLALFWQLGRLHDKRAYKHLVEGARSSRPRRSRTSCPRALHVGDAAVDGVLYRTATAEGTYVADRTVVVENRTDASDSPGGWVLTPLELGDGRAVLVNRGFVGYDGATARSSPPPPPPGEVTRRAASLFPTPAPRQLRGQGPEDRRAEVLARVDLERVDAQVDGDLLPAYIQLTTSRPAEPPVPAGHAADRGARPARHQRGPAPVLRRAVGDLQHDRRRSGYVLLLRKVARQEGRDPPGRQL